MYKSEIPSEDIIQDIEACNFQLCKSEKGFGDYWDEK